jgi:hypothetical protein
MARPYPGRAKQRALRKTIDCASSSALRIGDVIWVSRRPGALEMPWAQLGHSAANTPVAAHEWRG